MLVADCERDIRCNCLHSGSIEGCEAYAQRRSAEMWDQARRQGATLLDADCAELTRETAEEVCIGAGIPYDGEAFAASALADECRRYLFHGAHRSGDPCEYPVEYHLSGWSDCEVGSVCRDDEEGARCVATEDDGSICRRGDLFFGCPTDLVCVDFDEHTARCFPFTKVGDPCIGVRKDHCEGPPGQWCDLETSTCRAAPVSGEPCVDGDGWACAADAFCQDGTCRPRPGPGEPCHGFPDCAIGLNCWNGICEGDDACRF